jgi:hypothetical protein
VGLIIAVGAYKLLQPKPVQQAQVLLAPLLEERVSTPGNVFYTGSPKTVDYEGGTVTISGDPPPGGSFAIDDKMLLKVTRPDKSTQTWEHTFNDDCFANLTLEPQDVTSLFQEGVNVVEITLSDVCGGAAGTAGPVFLTVH